MRVTAFENRTDNSILLKRSVSNGVMMSFVHFNISFRIPSIPPAFPLGKLEMHNLTSSSVKEEFKMSGLFSVHSLQNISCSAINLTQIAFTSG